MRRILEIVLAIGLLGYAAAAFSKPPAYEVVKEKSFLKFAAIQNNSPVEGRFNDFNVDIRFDPEDLRHSYIKAEVMTGSLSVANDDVAKNLKLPEWLSTEVFPIATFKSQSITRMPSSDNYYAEGKLTLRGETSPITLNFQLQNIGDTRIAEGYATLRRIDFNVGEGQWAKDDVIKNEVQVKFRIFAVKKQP